MNRLAGKVALITGAASGIGEGISRAFASEGGLVFVSDLRDDAGQRVAESSRPSTRYVHLDVREEKHWISAVDSILKEHGRLDVVVNNAGITGFETANVPHDPERTTLADWHAVLATNLDGTFLGCKRAIRAMRPRGEGSIIKIGRASW